MNIRSSYENGPRGSLRQAAGSFAGAGSKVPADTKGDEELGDPKLADPVEEVPKVLHLFFKKRMIAIPDVLH